LDSGGSTVSIWPEKVLDFARKRGVQGVFFAVWDSRLGRSLIPSAARFAGGETDEPAGRRSPGRPVSPASRGDHQLSPSAGAAGGGGPLGLSGRAAPLGGRGGDPPRPLAR